MGGLLRNTIDFSLWVGAGVIVLLVVGGVLLYRKRKIPALGRLGFLLFLYFSNFFIITMARLTTNRTDYSLAQFRYQYIPNALLVLILIALLTYLFRLTRRRVIIICVLLIPILIYNAYLTFHYTELIDRQLAPLKNLLSILRKSITTGRINPNRPLYLHPRLPSLLPPLCWNEDMARFMEGNYQWLFSGPELESFTLDPTRAAWIINDRSFRLKPISPLRTGRSRRFAEEISP